MEGLLEEIGNIKNNRRKIEEYESERYGVSRFRQIYRAYKEEKERLRKLDLKICL